MSAGVRALGAILAEIADVPRGVAQIVEDTGLPRSSVFDILSRMEDADLVRRDSGYVRSGPQAMSVAFAAYGLGRVCGPAEAILTDLWEATGADVALLVGGSELLRLGASAGKDDYPVSVEAGAKSETGISIVMRLRQQLRPAERREALAALKRAGRSLDYYLAKVVRDRD